MDRRRLGDFEVSSIGLGCMGMSCAYGPGISEAEGVRVIHHALDGARTRCIRSRPCRASTRCGPAIDPLSLMRELGIGLVPFSPLGRGLLSGAIRSEDDFATDDWRRNNPRFQGSNLRANVALADRVRELAQARGATGAQLALAWVLAQGDDVVPIPGTTRVERIDENAGATQLALRDEELRELTDAVPRDAVAGTNR